MDTIPQSKEDEMLLGSLIITSPSGTITSDDRIMTHPAGTETSAGMDQTDSLMRAATVCSSTPVEAQKTGSQSFKSTTADAEPSSEDLCAAILLACLFCQPLDCFLATIQGCNSWMWSLCTSVCGCECTSLQPLLDVAHPCGLCGCAGARCSVCGCGCDVCSVCDICRQTTECLDFAMEISQMLYH